jgi:phosphatidyl-myo-inositol alpha-mannosyltransferase
MRIALACPYAWDAPGGVQLQVRGLAAQLRERGHQTMVLAPSAREWPEQGVTIVGRPVRVPFNGSVAPICPDPRSRPRIRAALREFAPDVVHVHEPFVPSTSLYAALSSPAPVVATFHSYMERSLLLTAASPLLIRLWHRLAGRIAVSRAAAGFVQRSFPGPLRIVPNGVDIDRFRLAKPAQVAPGRNMLFVSRLEPRKGFRTAAEALGRVLRRIPDARLLVVGDGPERGVYADAPPAVRERIAMLGAVSNAELPPYHAASEIFIAPATGRESFGIILVEALAAGLPVAGSDIPGYREVVRNGVEGLLSRPGDAAGLADGIVTLLSEPGLYARLREATTPRADRFRWQHVAEEVEEVYREAVAVGQA